MKPRMTELEYLEAFRHLADFGPAHGDVVEEMNRHIMEEAGKNLPFGWNLEQDGETILDT